MFFTPELLSRRDSGFGLLWLAATLGAKSSFNKLPKRSVMTADISQLCDLIAEPREPLALRLSSNLMIGVARVYKVKQEILLTDVTTCFNMLKKAIADVHVNGSVAALLQMGQPSVRPETVTVVADPATAFGMDFGHLFTQDWNERSREEEEEDNDSDDEFGRPKKNKKKGRAKASSISLAEQARAGSHTLNEHHDFMIPGSFDASFGPAGFGPSSSQAGGAYGLDDDFLEGLDLGGDIGEELAKELGEGWGGPALHAPSDINANLDALDVEMAAPADIEVDFQFQEDRAGPDVLDNQLAGEGLSPGRKRSYSDIAGPDGSIILPLSPLGQEQNAPTDKRVKRVRLLLDARTELTNQELERARASYIEGQAQLREEVAKKKAEKEGMRMLEEMVWGPPRGINAPALIQFWLENFKLQVEARAGHPGPEGILAKKARRIQRDEDRIGQVDDFNHAELDDRADINMDLDLGLGYENGIPQEDLNIDSRLRSSEEPGQARRASRPPSLIGSQFDLGLGTQAQDEIKSASQRSNMFPWDNAGVSSSISGVVFGAGGSDRLSLGRADTRLRRSSSLARGSGVGVPESPASFIPSGSHFEPDAFEFALPPEAASGIDTQATDLSVLSLERNSYNFLEYLKMQLNAFQSDTASLKFDNVAPIETSTRHVAAAAFYHCLVLSTKNLVGVQQNHPYDSIQLTIK